MPGFLGLGGMSWALCKAGDDRQATVAAFACDPFQIATLTEGGEWIAGRPLPDYRLLNLRYGVRFEPQDMDMIKAQPAGLLGLIQLVPSAAE